MDIMTPSILLVTAVVSISETRYVRLGLAAVLAQHIGFPGSNTHNVRNIDRVIQLTEATSRGNLVYLLV